MTFFEKLKKGVGIDEPEIKTVVEAEKPKKKKMRKVEVPKMEKIEENQPKADGLGAQKEKEWLEPEGQLTVDVYQTDGYIFIQSAVAGVDPQNLDITIENDVVTIKGMRPKPTDEPLNAPKDYFYQECYWGPFSRQIILPAEVDSSRVEAGMKEGVLTIKIPKIDRDKRRKVSVKE